MARRMRIQQPLMPRQMERTLPLILPSLSLSASGEREILEEGHGSESMQTELQSPLQRAKKAASKEEASAKNDDSIGSGEDEASKPKPKGKRGRKPSKAAAAGESGEAGDEDQGASPGKKRKKKSDDKGKNESAPDGPLLQGGVTNLISSSSSDSPAQGEGSSDAISNSQTALSTNAALLARNIASGMDDHALREHLLKQIHEAQVQKVNVQQHFNIYQSLLISEASRASDAELRHNLLEQAKKLPPSLMQQLHNAQQSEEHAQQALLIMQQRQLHLS
mmetsp:Transcript_17745/g.28586  ORF Transcript_17745/g.28586 Transcript_17745/m.28586 type:complete len:278 (-) Transcript_17745:389-1222(-)